MVRHCQGVSRCAGLICLGVDFGDISMIADYLKSRLTETSTLRGLVLLSAGMLGLDLSDTDVLTVISFGQLVAGLIGVVIPDSLKKNA